MINVIDCFLMNSWITSQNDVIRNTQIFSTIFIDITFLRINILYLHVEMKL